ncbi:hypothetical protein F4677DRAFT_240562 [Hypoxylon crocopeplum]|nr:hypothetical protein F4677DRAFT_240562 [Hypoxylon crocopeplum]
MPSRSSNHRDHYDDPYVFDDPYRHSTSPIRNAGYEYIGTDEPSPLSKPRRVPSPDLEPRRRPSPSRKSSRTTSPPRRYRHDGAYAPPPKTDRRPSPPRSSRHTSPPPRDSRKSHHVKHHKDQDTTQRPAVKRTKSFGQNGLKFLGEAAALYAATQAGSGKDRGRSRSRDRPHRSSHYDSEPKRHHHRHHSPTPSPSPPPRRRTRAYSDDAARRHRRHRSPSLSDESDYERDRGRRHRHSRASSYTKSPSPSPRRHRGRQAKSASSSFRSSTRGGSSKLPDKATADRWQMAARAALEAGGLTAFRLRKDPGSWTGEKGAKVATAALGAAAIDAFIDKDPRQAKSSGMKGFAENTISSLIASKLMGVKGPSRRRAKSRF